MQTFVEKHKIEFAIFFLAVAVRLIFFFVCLSANHGNVVETVRGQDWYFELSRNLLLGNGFSAYSSPPFTPYSYGVPLYPYLLFFLLWLTGSYALVSMFQLFIGAAIPILGMKLARMILPQKDEWKNIPLATGIFLALAPYQILHSFIFFTEAVFTALFCSFFIFFLKFLRKPEMKLAVYSGALLGLSALTKQTVQYVPILVVFFSLWHFRGKLSKALIIKIGCFCVAFFVVISPWLQRNYTMFRTASLGSGASFNIFYTLLPSVRAIENGTSFQEEQGKLTVLPNDPMFLASGRAAAAEIVHSSSALVKLSALSAFTFFTHDGMSTFLANAGISMNVPPGRPAVLLLLREPVLFAKTAWAYLHTNIAVAIFARIFWTMLAGFFFFGLYRFYRLRAYSSEILFAAILVFYFMLTTMINGLSVNARFRMPVEPIIFMFAAAGFIPLYRRVKKYV